MGIGRDSHNLADGEEKYHRHNDGKSRSIRDRASFFSVCDTADESDVYAHVCQYGIWAVSSGVSYF